MLDEAETVEELIAESTADKDAGEHHRGAQRAEQGVQLARGAGDAAGQARALALLALHRARLGEVEATIAAGLEALRWFEAIGDLAAQAQVQCTLALSCLEAGLTEQSLEYGLGALRAARACGDRRAECWALNRLGAAYEQLREFPRAFEWVSEALVLARGEQADEEAFACLNNRACAQLAFADHEHAAGRDFAAILESGLADATAALELARRSGNVHRRAISQSNLGAVLNRLGRHADAHAQLIECQSLATSHGFMGLARDIESDTAMALLGQGRSEEAIERLETLLRSLAPHSDRQLAQTIHSRLHAAYRAQGRFELALAHHEAAHALYVRLRDERAELQSRVLIDHAELIQARRAADRSRLDAEMQRMRAEELDRAAHIDALTGLFNRRFLDAQAPRLLERARAQGTPLCAALLDLDHFKGVNDRFGHAVGDAVLTQIGVLIRKATRTSDLAVRIGGEEFLIVYVDTALEPASDAAQRLRAAVQEHAWVEMQTGLNTTASLGIAAWSGSESFQRWYERIDAALYTAKREGRNRVVKAP